MEIRPRKVKPRPTVEAAAEAVGPRAVKPTEVPAGVMGDRYVQAIEALAGAPTRALHEAAKLLAEELDLSVEAALETINDIIRKKRERDRSVLASTKLQRRRPKFRTLTLKVADLRPGDVLVGTRENAGQVVRSVSVSHAGTGGVILFRGRGNDDGYAVRKTDTLRVRRRLQLP
jgi:hypothetical protein